jgi:hypothetical protein
MTRVGGQIERASNSLFEKGIDDGKNQHGDV